MHATSKRARTYLSESVLARFAGSLFARRQA
jgi:hypothetical protein